MATQKDTSKQGEVIPKDQVGFSLTEQFTVYGLDGKKAGTMTVAELITEVTTVQSAAQGLAQHLHSMALGCKNLPALKRTLQTIETSQGWHSGRGKPTTDSGTIAAPSLYTDYKSKLLRAAEKGVLWESKTLNEARTKLAKLEHKAKVQENLKTQAAHRAKVEEQAKLVVKIAEHPEEARGDLTEKFEAVIQTIRKQFALASLGIQTGMVRDFAKLAAQFKHAQELEDAARNTEANQAAQEASRAANAA